MKTPLAAFSKWYGSNSQPTWVQTIKLWSWFTVAICVLVRTVIMVQSLPVNKVYTESKSSDYKPVELSWDGGSNSIAKFISGSVLTFDSNTPAVCEDSIVRAYGRGLEMGVKLEYQNPQHFTPDCKGTNTRVWYITGNFTNGEGKNHIEECIEGKWVPKDFSKNHLLFNVSTTAIVTTP